MGVDDIYSTSNTGLRLGLCLGLHDQSTERNQSQKKKVLKNPSKCSDNNNKAYPSLTLGPPEEEEEEEEVNNSNDQLPAAVSKSTIESCRDHHQYYYSRAQVVTSPSAESSAFSYSSSIKRETADHQVLLGGEELIELDIDQVEKVAASVDEDGNPRKKLRLTKEQSAVLEENFREHSTLNPVPNLICFYLLVSFCCNYIIGATLR